MDKYNIKVGDYVETIDNGIGYVTDVYNNSFKWMIVKPRSTSYAAKSGSVFIDSFDNVEDFYKRIGVNYFSKKKTEFKPINKYNQNGIITYTDKLNELIDNINEIQERLNEYDNTRAN